MNTLFVAWLPVSVQVYLANVAVISVIVCGGGLFVERLCRWASLPLRHALLVGTLISAVSAPIVIGVMLASGRSLIQFNVASSTVPAVARTGTSSSGRSEGFSSSDGIAPQEIRLANAVDKNRAADMAAFREETSTGAPMLSQIGRLVWLEVLPLVGTSLTLIWVVGCAWGIYRLMRGLWQFVVLKPHASADGGCKSLRIGCDYGSTTWIVEMPEGLRIGGDSITAIDRAVSSNDCFAEEDCFVIRQRSTARLVSA